MHLYHQGHHMPLYWQIPNTNKKLKQAKGLKKLCCVFTTLSCHSNLNPLFDCMPHLKKMAYLMECI